uniref:P7 PROTEIN n=1 Tax=Hepacivirus hominis TaxID=3052230 RepID=UPI0003903F5B|nr:Chain A, P7 PROTEIN [Hepacivirus hominis]
GPLGSPEFAAMDYKDDDDKALENLVVLNAASVAGAHGILSFLVFFCAAWYIKGRLAPGAAYAFYGVWPLLLLLLALPPRAYAAAAS